MFTFFWFYQDGGIVLFGAPGTLVENNTIWVETVRSRCMDRLTVSTNRQASDDITWRNQHGGLRALER